MSIPKRYIETGWYRNISFQYLNRNGQWNEIQNFVPMSHCPTKEKSFLMESHYSKFVSKGREYCHEKNTIK